MSTTSFDKEFGILQEMGQETFVLRGSNIIVEVLDREEIKTAGGLIMASDPKQMKGNTINAHEVIVAKVLMCGQGYWNENEHPNPDNGFYEPLEVKPGAIVFLPPHSYQLLSHFPGIQRPTANKLAMVKMDALTAYYPSQQAYELAKSKLNG